jgi:hypothetical protein
MVITPRLSLLHVGPLGGQGVNVENVASNLCNHYPTLNGYPRRRDRKHRVDILRQYMLRAPAAGDNAASNRWLLPAILCYWLCFS